MKIDFAAVRQCLKAFDFGTLFREHLGWDRHQARLDIPVESGVISLQAIAQKRGFVAFVCDSIPDRATRMKIDRLVTKSNREHFIIYASEPTGVQIWQWVRREAGRPSSSHDHRFEVAGNGDALIQRLEKIAITLEEEESLTVVDVVGRTKAAFDVEKVTKKFYERFKTEHAAFHKLIRGIDGEGDREWYTSLMLNRLMFVYFIQKKGFLDSDPDYLRNRLTRVKALKGKDKFHSFYRYFLVRMFHDGLGKPKGDRRLDRELEQLLGQVPYLNGGFFEVHALEERNTEIDIPDQAFVRLFDFFDEFSWHLDERPLRTGNEINPDVVGYIFEKYINQKQMGAYYTKEDITEYISKNTIIPFLFDAAQKKCAIAFRPDSFLWGLLRSDPDRYIYAAVRQGVIDEKGQVIPLPKEIAAGIDDVTRRDGWNRPASERFGLPTETWREHVARRQRCLELRSKLAAGEVVAINDLITLNLDIWQFARDTIVNCEGPELLRAFWQAIAGRTAPKGNEKFESGITVLDPTCGSGAFLFAALRILETLYADCLERMTMFLDDAAGSKAHPEKYADFRQTLEQIGKHPNERYFILKSIIINNLFGVDIMEEAVEICKLRLFLKLVAQVERVDQIEPLPDIDFNIRSGNTLVGYVSIDEIRKARSTERRGNSTQKRLVHNADDEEIRRLEEDALAVERCFSHFRVQQTTHGGKITAKDKAELHKRLDKLDSELDYQLAVEYGVHIQGKNPRALAAWKASHQPFHWIVKFYGIMSQGGFDVVIGNPPWKEYSAVKHTYTVRTFQTEPCGNLHGLCTERSLRIRSSNGWLSFIVQLPLTCSSRMNTVRTILHENSDVLFVAPFDDRPGKLFDGLQHCRSVIFLSRATALRKPGHLRTTRYQRWRTEARSSLFGQFEYATAEFPSLHPSIFPKLGNNLDVEIFDQLLSMSDTTLDRLISTRDQRHFIFYQEATQYWIKAVIGLPYYEKDGVAGAPAHGRYLYFDNAMNCAAVCAILNSSLFYKYFITYGDCFHLSETLVGAFPVVSTMLDDIELSTLGLQVDRALKKSASTKTIKTKDGASISYAEFRASECKAIIDQIDDCLAKHFRLNPKQIEAIRTFDISFRLGQENIDSIG